MVHSIRERLDVGCGCYPTGTVNCDLYVKDIGHRSTDKAARGSVGRMINPKHIENFVLCDSQHLPFRDNTFKLVFSSHVVEHLSNPQLFLHELIRVSSSRVTIECPHRLGDRIQHPFHQYLYKPFHIQHLNKAWFNAACKCENVESRITYSSYYCLPHEVFPLFRIPYSLEVQIWKQ